MSGRQLDEPGFVEVVREELEASGLAPDRLVLEITESTLMDDAPAVIGKLHALKAELRHRWHTPVVQLGQWLRSVVQGWLNYHAVPGNMDCLNSFRAQVIWRWYRALRRRSQRDRMTWERFWLLVDQWIPSAKILHPHPNDRFYAKHPK